MKGRPILGVLVLLLLGWGQSALAATEVAGVIEGDTVWTLAESPFLITEHVYFSPIEPGATLTIEPGVTVEFVDGSSLNVFGDLVVNGTPDNKVQFTSSDSSNWEVNVFDASDTQLNNLDISNSDWGISVFNSKVSANSVSILDGDGSFFMQDSEATVNNIQVESGDVMLFDSNTTLTDVVMGDGMVLVDGGQLSLSGLTSSEGFLGIFNTTASLSNINISNVVHGPAVLFGNTTTTASQLNLQNVALGVEIYDNSNVTLNGLQAHTITNGPAVLVGDSEARVNDSVLNNGVNLGINISGSSVVEISDVSVTNFAGPGIQSSGVSFTGSDLLLSNNLFGFINSSLATINNSKIENNTIIGVVHAGESTFNIANSLIAGNGVAGADSSGLIPLDARGNYWGDPSGPLHDTINPEGFGNAVMGNAVIEPWLTEYCEANCHSNIMFLPGIMSSRLYEDGEQLWEPGLFMEDEEFEALYLNESGKSVSPDIYTEDVLDNGYAYGKFVEDLAELKIDGTINDYEAVPYDWRLSMEDVLSTGTKREDGTIIYGTSETEPYIESTLRRLAANSKSGKVTIVAHSNGGLVTKALINKLDNESAALIDQVIFVGVPQLGTPQAIGALLHGYNAGLPDVYPFILSAERSRDLAINMPMIYQLMPFADYYDGEGVEVHTPYITFEDGVATQLLIDRYGYAVTPNELQDFLSGAEGRISAPYNDLANPINANAVLLADSLAMQSEIDSSWQAPDGIKVHQIAGIGEGTLAGIRYKTIQKCVSSTFGVCHERAPALSYEPVTVIDGDGTVVVPSALAMSETDTERWWVDLYASNIERFRFGPLKNKHADLLEIDELRDLIFENLIFNTANVIPTYLYSEQPSTQDKERLVFTLHSPLKLSAVGSDGNVVNEKEVTMPGSTYVRYGEVQVLTVPATTEFTILLTGERDGSFTLEMEEFIDNESIATSTFAAIPSGTSTRATISFDRGTLEDAGVLQIDHNGDSVIDFSYSPVIGETVYEPDPVVAIETSSGGGRSKPKGQVLGATTDVKNLTSDLMRIQSLAILLISLKNQISGQQYTEIENRLRYLLSTVLIHLNTRGEV